jgi:hypothetical protein
MLDLLAAVTVTVTPFATVLALLLLAGALERRRRERTDRQVAVTDAIHRRLGAVVAPTVEAPIVGPWRLRIPVPLDRPALVSDVVATAHAALGPSRDFRIVLERQG